MMAMWETENEERATLFHAQENLLEIVEKSKII